jgi:hypothetical protein
MDFVEFQKIPRLTRECVITEKIDGTNGVIYIGENGEFLIGSRTRWITPQDDNYGFAKWCEANKEELLKLGVGTHYGEWWGQGIQRNYGLKEKRFSLFNSKRWTDDTVRPVCCGVVPVLKIYTFDSNVIDEVIKDLTLNGSKAVPGFMKPEGIVIYHTASRQYFKKTIEKDTEHKTASSPIL